MTLRAVTFTKKKKPSKLGRHYHESFKEEISVQKVQSSVDEQVTCPSPPRPFLSSTGDIKVPSQSILVQQSQYQFDTNVLQIPLPFSRPELPAPSLHIEATLGNDGLQIRQGFRFVF